jgi:hypothetical protein
LEPGFDTPEDVAMLGFPPHLCRVIGTRVNGDHAFVLLDTGSPGRPYLYGQHCRRRNGLWEDAGSGNAPDWQRTDEVTDVGVLTFWGEAPAGADAVRVALGAATVEAPVVHGAWLVVWWSQPPPPPPPPPNDGWPSVQSYRICASWVGA